MAEWLFAQNGVVLYTSLFLLLMAGAIGLPVPEDIPLIFGGVMLHRSNADPIAMFITCYVGIIIGDTIIFFLGRKVGSSVQKRDWLSAKFSPALIEKTKLELEKRRFFTIVLARHLFYFRTVTFLTCGAVKMSFSKFFIADAFAALISASIMLSLGYFFSDQYERVFAFLKGTKEVALWVGLFGLIWLFRHLRKKRKAAELTPPNN